MAAAEQLSNQSIADKEREQNGDGQKQSGQDKGKFEPEWARRGADNHVARKQNKIVPVNRHGCSGGGRKEIENQSCHPELGSDSIGDEEKKGQSIPQNRGILGAEDGVLGKAFENDPEGYGPSTLIFSLEMQLQKEIIKFEIEIAPEKQRPKNKRDDIFGHVQPVARGPEGDIFAML